jgi:hypothetical protein
MSLANMAEPSFADRFCERFNCARAQYESRALRECLYGHARLLVPWLRRLLPWAFRPDLELIRRMAPMADFDDTFVEVLKFQDYNRQRWSFLRNALRLRISGRAARQMARDVFATAGRGSKG